MASVGGFGPTRTPAMGSNTNRPRTQSAGGSVCLGGGSTAWRGACAIWATLLESGALQLARVGAIPQGSQS